MTLTAQQKRLLRWLGYPLLAVLVFAFALAHTFPYERLKGKIIEVLSVKYDVSIADIGPGLWPGNIEISTVMLKTRPDSPEETPVVLVVDEAELGFGIFAALFGGLDLEIEAHLAGGIIEGQIEADDEYLAIDIETENLPLGGFPAIADAVGLPMTGALNANIALKLPRAAGEKGGGGVQWSEADGAIALACAGCTVGDGEAKMKMKPKAGRGGLRARRASIFADEGLTVPRLDLGTAVAKIDIEDGVGVIDSFTATSKDGFLKITGEIRFAEPVGTSTFPGCMTFKLSDALKAREKTFSGIEAMMPPKARQPDGSFAIPTKGTLAALRWDVRSECSEGGSSGADESERVGRRPELRELPEPPPERDRPALGAMPDDSSDSALGGDADREARGLRDDPEDIAGRGSREIPEPELEGPGNSGPELGRVRDDVRITDEPASRDDGDRDIDDAPGDPGEDGERLDGERDRDDRHRDRGHDDDEDEDEDVGDPGGDEQDLRRNEDF